MNTNKNINIDIFSKENECFFKEYVEILINRLTHSNLSLEIDLGNADSHENAIRLKDNMRAFKFLLNRILEDKTLTESEIICIADMINADSIYVSNGYRKEGIGDFIVDTNIPISKSSSISSEMKNLLNNYYGQWQDLDSFEREARFHIGFIRIHPFEDGNGRTSRLLLNYNLLCQGLAPVIITTDFLEYYHTYIKENDYLGLANLFKIQSTKENKIIDKLWEDYCLRKEDEHTL